jgi:hypothetical protein
MKPRFSMILVAGLWVCSMPSLSAPPAPTKPEKSSTPPTTVPPRLVFRSVPSLPPIARDSKGLPPPRFCHLGEDCLALDSHPFELCQVSGKRCSDKLAEVLRVERPMDRSPPTPAVKTSR